MHHAKLISWSEDGGDGNYDIGVYRYDGDSAGIYDTRGDNLERLIRRYDATISRRNVEEVVAIMRAECPVVSPCSDADLVAVNNGVYDYRNKLLFEFDPEFVFISKIETNSSEPGSQLRAARKNSLRLSFCGCVLMRRLISSTSLKLRIV